MSFSEISETEMMLHGYGLTVAEMFYRLPDHPSILNSFIWQGYDLQPEYPRLTRFIEFWQREIDGALHSVRFAHRKLIAPGKWRKVTHDIHIEDEVFTRWPTC